MHSYLRLEITTEHNPRIILRRLDRHLLDSSYVEGVDTAMQIISEVSISDDGLSTNLFNSEKSLTLSGSYKRERKKSLQGNCKSLPDIVLPGPKY